jgi:hypothetical protein
MNERQEIERNSRTISQLIVICESGLYHDIHYKSRSPTYMKYYNNKEQHFDDLKIELKSFLLTSFQSFITKNSKTFN